MDNRKRFRTSDSPQNSWASGTNIADHSGMLLLLENQLKALPPSEDPAVLAVYWQLYCSYATLSTIVDSVGPTHELIDPEERQRKSIVVISGLAEGSSNLPSERIKHDVKAVTELLDTANIEVSFLSTLRLGIKSGDRPRLLKVFFSDMEAAGKVLRLLSQYKRSSNCRLQFRHSMTREERVERKMLYDTCKTKREQAAANNQDSDFIVYADQVMLRSEVDTFKAKNRRNSGPTGANRVPLGNPRVGNGASGSARLTELQLPWLKKAAELSKEKIVNPNFDSVSNEEQLSNRA